jgi:hypothetical protein
MTPEEIADRFDISISAAKIRIQEIARIQRKRDGVARLLPPSVVEFLKERKELK